MERPLFNSALAIRWQLRLYIGANLRKKQVKNFLSDVTNVIYSYPQYYKDYGSLVVFESFKNIIEVMLNKSVVGSSASQSQSQSASGLSNLLNELLIRCLEHEGYFNALVQALDVSRGKQATLLEVLSKTQDSRTLPVQLVLTLALYLRKRYERGKDQQYATMALFKKLEDYFDTNKPLIFKAHIYEPLLQVLNQELMMSNNPAKTADIHRYMQYIIETCRPGESQEFVQIFNESKKIISGAGAPQYLTNRYLPPRSLEAPATKILGKIKAISKVSMNAGQAIMKDLDDHSVQILPKTLHSFGRDVGSKDLEPPCELQVTELLLFLASRREHIALSEEAYEQMRASGSKKAVGVKMQNGQFIRQHDDYLLPLLNAIIMSVNQDPHAQLEAMKDSEKQPKVHPFLNLVNQIQFALDARSVNWHSVIQKMDIVHTQRFPISPLKRPNNTSFHVLPQNYGIEPSLHYPNTAYGFGTLIELVSKMSNTQTQIVHHLVTQMFRGVWKNVSLQVSLLEGFFDLVFNPQLSESCFLMATNARIQDIQYFLSDVAQKVLLGSGSHVPDKFIPQFIEYDPSRHSNMIHEGENHPQPVPITFSHLTKGEYRLLTSLPLYDLLFKLASGHRMHQRIKEIFTRWFIRFAKEQLLFSLAYYATKSKKRHPLLEELLTDLMRHAFSPLVQTPVLFEELWRIHKTLCIKVMSQLYKEKNIVEADPASTQGPDFQLQHLTLSRVLDLTQQEKDALLSIVKCSDYEFAIALGVLAGKREFLHFDEWLNDRINSKAGAPFVLKMLQKLEQLILNPMNNAIGESKMAHGEFTAMISRSELRQKRDQIIEKSQMSMLSISMLFMNLSTFCNQMGPNAPRALDRIAIEAIIHSQEALAQLMPDIIAPTSEFSNIVGGPITRPVYQQQVQYTDQRDQSPMSHLSHSSGSSLDTSHSLSNNPTQEIEKEANSVLEKTFVGQNTPEGLIETMNKLKKSNRKKDREVYACIMHNLLDEYNFFHKYPERELQIMGKIFGLIVKEQLIHDIPMLQKVIRKYIFQTLSRTSGSLFKFGQTALDQMVGCLHKWPEYVSSILDLPTASNLSEPMKAAMRKIVENHEKRMKDPKPEEPEPDTESPKRSAKPTKKGRGASKQGGKQQHEYVEQSDQHKQLEQVNTMPTIDKEDFRYKSSISTEGPLLKLPKMGGSLDVKAQAFVPKQPISFGQSGAAASTTPPPNFMEHITKAMQYSDAGAPPNKLSQSLQLTTTSPDFTPSDISALKPLQILTLKRPELTQNLKERFNSMFNKLTPTNIQKCIEEAYRTVTNVVTAQALALALVTTRATSEPKYQDLYIQFVEKIRSHFQLHDSSQSNYQNCLANLPDLVLSETTVAIGRLLSFLGLLHEKAKHQGVEVSSFVGLRFDKKILKNLGSFLGKQTVHQHKPILKKQLHIHQMLKEAYAEPKLYMTYAVGLLNAIFEFRNIGPTPFSKSNPWILSILKMVNQIGAKYLKEKNETRQPVEILSLFEKFSYSENYIGEPPKLTNFVVFSPQILKQLISSDSRFNKAEPERAKEQEVQQAPPKKEILALPSQPKPRESQSNQEEQEGVTGSRLQRFVSVDPSLRPIQERYKVSLRDLAARAVDKAILEILTPVIERSVTIALITTKKLVLKDFQLEPDKEKLTKAARDSAKCFAGSLALVTCREPLRVSLQNYLKLELEEQVKDMSREDKEQVINKISQDNECIKLGCSLIQKTVIERAVAHVENDQIIREAILVREKYQAEKDRKSFSQFLSEEMERRLKHMHPTPGEVFNAVNTELLSSVPASSEGLTPNQLVIYEEFSKTIEESPSRPVREIIEPISSSFLRMVDAIRVGGQSLRQNDLSANTAAAEQIKKIQAHVSKVKKEKSGNLQQQMALLEKELENWWKESLLKSIFFDSEEAQMLALSQLMSALSALEFGKSVRRAMALWLFRMQKHCFSQLHEISSNNQESRTKILSTFIEVTSLMMKKRLVGLEEWDEANAMELDSLFERRKASASISREEQQILEDQELNFLLNYINEVCALLVSGREDSVNSERPLQIGDLPKLTQFIQKFLRDNVLLSGPSSLPSSLSLIHPLQNVALSQLYRNLTGQEGELENDWTKIPHNKFRQKIEEVLHNLMIYYVQNRRKDSINQIVQYQKVVCCKFGLTKSPEMNKNAVTHFIRTALSVVLRRCHFDAESGETLEYPPDRLDYRFADLFMVFMYEYIFNPELEEMDRTNQQKELVRILLDIFRDSIIENHTKEGLQFNPRPYYRMLLFFINTTNSSGVTLFLVPFADFLHSVNPLLLPGFAITWMSLFSNGSFMPRLFKLPLGHLAQLVCDLLDLLTDIMPEAEKQWSPAFENYYFATLRILDILSKECPDVLVKYHFDILHSAPEDAIQIRNIILSAVPSTLKHLPSPTDPNLSVEQIPGAKEVPEVLSSFEKYLEGSKTATGSLPSLRGQVDYFMRVDISDAEREQTVVQMANKIYMIKSAEQGKPEKIIHALVLMIMKKAAQENKFGKQGLATRLLEDLSMKLSMEELQLLVNAIINELRFVSKYMWLASYILLQLINSPQEQHQKLVSIALMKRIGAKPPHPWGLRVTMREILEHDKKYNFFEKPFIKSDKKVFQRFKQLLTTLTTSH